MTFCELRYGNKITYQFPILSSSFHLLLVNSKYSWSHLAWNIISIGGKKYYSNSVCTYWPIFGTNFAYLLQLRSRVKFIEFKKPTTTPSFTSLWLIYVLCFAFDRAGRLSVPLWYLSTIKHSECYLIVLFFGGGGGSPY